MGSVHRAATSLLVLLLLAGCGVRPGPPSLAVGAGRDAESTMLAAVYTAALRSTGVPAHVQTVDDPVVALDAGAITVLPGFTGRLLAVFAPDATVLADRQVYRAMVGALPEGIAAGDYATAAQDKPALAVTERTVFAWRSTDLQAVPRHCDQLSLGRVAGTWTPTRLGSCRLTTPDEFPDAATLFRALRSGRLTAAWTGTAAPETPDDLVVLTDRTPTLVRAENVVPLYRRNELAEPQLLSLNQVAGALDTATLVQLRRAVADGADPQDVADSWLAEHPLWH